MVCVGGASAIKSESGEGESVVEDDWSEGGEDEQEELGVAEVNGWSPRWWWHPEGIVVERS